MRKKIASAFFCSIVLAAVAFAQNQDSQIPQQRVAPGLGQDGGVRGRLHSIIIPPKPGSPFTSTLHTEWLNALSDGGTIAVGNDRRIARDSKGRIYQERWALVPQNGNQESRMTAIQISDPEAHALYTCMMDGRHVCDVTNYAASLSVVESAGPRAGSFPDGNGNSTREDLGHQSVAGVDTVGTRETTTYSPGAFGNDSPFTVERESWFSAQLGIDLQSKVSNPRFGTQTFTVTSVTLAEPDAGLFQLPKGFRTVDHRPAVRQRAAN